MLKKDKKGFTLVEILIALVILSMGIAMLITMFTVGLKGVTANQRRTQATNLAQDLMDEIMGKNFPTGTNTKESNRSLYDNIQDYSTWGNPTLNDPPKNYSEGDLTLYTGFGRGVSIYDVNSNDLNNAADPTPDGTYSIVRIRVRVFHADIGNVDLITVRTSSVY